MRLAKPRARTNLPSLIITNDDDDNNNIQMMHPFHYGLDSLALEGMHTLKMLINANWLWWFELVVVKALPKGLPEQFSMNLEEEEETNFKVNSIPCLQNEDAKSNHANPSRIYLEGKKGLLRSN